MSPKSEIPSWQRASADSPSSAPPQEEEQQQEESTLAPVPTEEDLPSLESDDRNPERSELLEQASRFLDDPAIRDAPREKKVTFLQSKGVDEEDIDALLGAETIQDDFSQLEEVGERAWSTVSLFQLLYYRRSIILALRFLPKLYVSTILIL